MLMKIGRPSKTSSRKPRMFAMRFPGRFCQRSQMVCDMYSSGIVAKSSRVPDPTVDRRVSVSGAGPVFCDDGAMDVAKRSQSAVAV